MDVINQLSPHCNKELGHLRPRIRSSEADRASLLSLPPRRETLASGYEEMAYPLGTLDSFDDFLLLSGSVRPRQTYDEGELSWEMLQVAVQSLLVVSSMQHSISLEQDSLDDSQELCIFQEQMLDLIV